MNYSEYRKEFCDLDYLYVKSLREITVQIENYIDNRCNDSNKLENILYGIKPIKEYAVYIENTKFTSLVSSTEHRVEDMLINSRTT